MPKSISYAFGEPIVELAQIAGPPPRFFSDLDVRHPVASMRRPLMDIELPEGAGDLSPAGFIFHLPRSGSTLTARMLAAPASCASIVEPETINALLSSPEAAGRLKPVWLRRLCQLYCAAFADTHRHLFVKVSSWAVLREPTFAEAFPAAPGCFVHRDPVEVLVQLLQRPAGWMSEHARPFILDSQHEAASLSVEEYCARVLQRFCEAALRGAPRLRALAYEDILDEAPALAERHFGVEVRAADRQAMVEVARYDSDDWSLRRLYGEDPEDLAARATPSVKALAQRFVDEPRRMLLRQNGP
jgi:hypothetical protein